MATAAGPSGPEMPAGSDGPAPASGTIPLRSWQYGIAPAFIGLYLLIIFFDQLGPYTLAVGGLWPSVLGAVVGGALGFVLLFYAPAMRAWRLRSGLTDLAACTFGTAGARWVPGVVLALVQIGWFAVTIYYAADLSLKALNLGGLISPTAVDTPPPASAPAWGGHVFLTTITLWMLAAATLGPLLVKIITAILSIYAIFPALALGGLMLWSLGGFRGEIPALTAEGNGVAAFRMMVQLVFGYTATAGVLAIDWGATSRTARDVRLGGLVGAALAPPIVVSLALVTVAGALAYQTIPLGPEGTVVGASVIPEPAPEMYVYHHVVLEEGLGGPLGCILMLTFCLALLGPACTTPTVYSRQLAATWPRVPRLAWALLGAALAWPLAATGLAGNLPIVFGLAGALLAPVAGVIAADSVRDRGRVPVARAGVDLSALLAWAVGLGIGLLPYIGPLLGAPVLARVEPAAVLACAFAFLIRLFTGKPIWTGGTVPATPPPPGSDERAEGVGTG